MHNLQLTNEDVVRDVLKATNIEIDYDAYEKPVFVCTKTRSKLFYENEDGEFNKAYGLLIFKMCFFIEDLLEINADPSEVFDAICNISHTKKMHDMGCKMLNGEWLYPFDENWENAYAIVKV